MRKLSEEEQKELAILKASNEMIKKTQEEAKLRKRGSKTLSLLNGIESEIESKVKNIGATKEDMESIEYSKPIEKKKDILSNDSVTKNNTASNNSNDITLLQSKPDEIKPIINSNSSTATGNSNNNRRRGKAKVTTSSEVNMQDESNNVVTMIDETIPYDVLPLPSNGEVYPNKKGKIAVSYLTAADENIITSPNLYRDGTILDVLLSRKIMDKSINPDLLCKGDRDAIILWLRANGYGVDFPISVRDPKTGKDFETTIDLSNIKTKDFTLKGDDEGYFDYETVIRKDKIKFKFFNRLDELELNDIENGDKGSGTKKRLEKIVSDLKEELMNTDMLSDNDRNKMISCINTIESWEKNIPSDSGNGVDGNENHTITNTMEMSIVEVNGNRDRNFIHRYVITMPAKEALEFRKYLSKHEPGMDFRITVERPESLGGGSFDTFLKLDNTLFLNIS